MTLATETIKQWRSDAENIARRSCEYETEYSAAEAILALTAELLANREAQPVIVVGDDGGDALAYRRLIQSFAPGTKLYTAPPSPAYPERLPCPVHLLPGLKFGKGVPTRSMIDALVRRAGYESERDAMTPEQKAEDDARIEAFKALLPRPPAPAVPPEKKLPELMMASYHEAIGWNACRAAMLAQPVSSGYTLNSPVIPDGCQWTYDEQDYKWDSGCGEAWMFSDGGPVENGVKFCQGCGKPVLLAAAPEGGNDHDTGR
ncbi:hypothetical protein I5R69_15385 [Serratia marcescens]|nr:hypothetical protein [Serratia marcescens]